MGEFCGECSGWQMRDRVVSVECYAVGTVWFDLPVVFQTKRVYGTSCSESPSGYN